jgi:chromosome segregation ATPase
VVLCLFYLVDAWKVFRAGGGILKSVGWVFFFPGYRKSFVDYLISFSFGWWLAAIVLFVFILYLFDDVEELNNLREKIQSSEKRLSSLKGEIDKLNGELQRLEEKRKDLKTDIDYLEHEKTVVWNDLEELKEQKRNLSLYIEETLRRAYEEGKEKGYRSVLNELRSLRIQKSIVLDLFDRNKEFKDLLKRLTGKTIRQYLEQEKKRRLKPKESG